MTFGAVFPRVLRPVFGPGLASGATPWYLAGGAPVPVAVYQPKGAASLAASYINLVNPGTYDATPGVAPTFATETGWTFNGSTQWLSTDFIPTANTSVLCRYSALSGTGYLFGTRTGSTGRLSIQPANAGIAVSYERSTNAVLVGPQLTSGVLAVAGGTGFRNGVSDATLTSWTGSASYPIMIAARNVDGTPSQFGNFTLQTFAIYDTSTNHATWMPAVMAEAAAL